MLKLTSKILPLSKTLMTSCQIWVKNQQRKSRKRKKKKNNSIAPHQQDKLLLMRRGALAGTFMHGANAHISTYTHAHTCI